MRFESGTRTTTAAPPPPISDAAETHLVETPVMELVHPALANAWKIDNTKEICWIFDVTHPPRQFKRGVVYTGQEFPAKKPPYGDLTETDDPKNGLLPFAPCKRRYVFPLHNNRCDSLPAAGSIRSNTRSTLNPSYPGRRARLNGSPLSGAPKPRTSRRRTAR